MQMAAFGISTGVGEIMVRDKNNVLNQNYQAQALVLRLRLTTATASLSNRIIYDFESPVWTTILSMKAPELAHQHHSEHGVQHETGKLRS